MPRLRRLYLKGNGAAAAQMIALGGGPQLLASLDSLQELYLGLCVFVEYDGAPCVPALVSPLLPRCLGRGSRACRAAGSLLRCLSSRPEVGCSALRRRMPGTCISLGGAGLRPAPAAPASTLPLASTGGQCMSCDGTRCPCLRAPERQPAPSWHSRPLQKGALLAPLLAPSWRSRPLWPPTLMLS